jgi:hypothetical protein
LLEPTTLDARRHHRKLPAAQARGWRAVECDDTFEHGPYAGGHETEEDAFTTSVYTDEGELPLQFTLAGALRRCPASCAGR